MELPLILGLITLVGWGSGDIFTIFSSRKIGANNTTFWIFLYSFFLSLILFFWAPNDFTKITLWLLVLNIFLGVLYVTGNVLISEAFRLSSAPLVGIIIQSFPAVVLILSALIFKDKIDTNQWFFIVIIFLGVLLCSVDMRKLVTMRAEIDKGTYFALLAMIFLSIYFTFSRILINELGWYIPNLIATACFPIIYLFIRKSGEKLTFPKELKLVLAIFLVALLIRAGDFALNYGLAIPNGSAIVAPLASAAPILFVTLSSIVYKDPISKQQLLGIITTLIGLVLLTTIG